MKERGGVDKNMNGVNKKKLGIIIGVATVVLVAVIAVVLALCLKGCGSGKETAGNGNQSVSETDKNGITNGTSGENTEGTKDNSGTAGGEGNTDNGGGSSGNGGGGSESSNIAANVVAQFKAGNSWDSNGKKFVQYEVIITNNSSEDVKEWKVSVPIKNGLSVSQGWNCTTSVSGSDLIIAPADYNKIISRGGSVSGIGIIVSMDSEYALGDYKMEATGSGGTTVADGGSGSSSDSGNGGSSGGSSGSGSSSGGSSGSGSSSGGSSGSGSSSSGTGDSGTSTTPVTPPEAYGGLHVVGTDLVDAKGNKIQLKGPSTHGIQWFPQYVNKEAFKTFRDDWGANVIRLAMYVREGGYLEGNKEEFKKKIDDGVRYATELGMYVIIDWHVLAFNPNECKNEAIAFFEEMAKKYCNNNNVIYEICNEPTGSEWNSQIKPYAESVISAIRKYDNDALVLVGTNTWSQDVDKVIGNKLSDHNCMYVLHFYAATHRDDLRNKLKRAVENGVPVFVSECSICDASGNGGIDYNSAAEWAKLFKQYNISYIAWNISNKGETSALISPSCNKTSGWTADELSETGKWWRKLMRGEI